jgi:DNA-binding MarR family transcriptional regulator
MNATVTPDLLDRIISKWKEAIPELDPTPLEVVGRVIVLAQRLERSVSQALEPHGLTLGQFDILATLRRNGPAGQLSPRELLKNVALSSGGMTARLDKLEQAGLVVRKPDANDRRMLMIELTEKGREAIEAAAAARFEEARRSLPPFDADEVEVLSQLLRRWLAGLTAE